MRPKKIILCVDDNEQELSVLKFMLATNGYRVVSACTGQEAIGIFSEVQGGPGSGGFGMPQMNGNQLIDRLKMIAPHVPMILLGDLNKMSSEMHAARCAVGQEELLAAGTAGADQDHERAQARTAQGHDARGGGGTGDAS